jgi:TolB-like protein/tetratricopeptide (TPR) repeat protein/predicted Ser/Thr protein kinase
MTRLGDGGRIGPYEVLGPLGAGGMGEVYLARDTRLGREVALKVLPPETARDPSRLARFEREARAVAAVNHPNIVTLHAIEEIEGERVIVMERVDGRPLSAVIAPRGLPLARVLDIAVPIADALSAAHERGVVHRDLKPPNVMVSDEGRVKVLDFGLAKWVAASDGVETAAPTATRTLEGVVVGTVPYMAPEQLRGEPVDARADIFSFGVMLYEMAAGARPFRGDTSADLTAAILREEPPSLASARTDLPARFVRLVSRCLEKDPRRRIQSAIDLRQQLQDLAEELRGGAVMAAAPTVSAPPAAPRTHRPWLWAAAAIGLVAAVAFATWQLPRLRSLGTGGRRPPGIRSIAVLPFDNLTRDASQDYFVDGLHDALITELAKLGTFGVTSRNSVMRYKGRALAMKDVAHELGVDALLEGSVLRTGNRVRITAQLIRGSTDEHVWAESYDRDLGDVLALLTDVSRAVAGRVQARVVDDAVPPAVAAPQPVVTPRVRPEAYEAYLRGREAMMGAASLRRLAEAADLFKQAATLDPGLAPAWGQLAACAAARAFLRLGPVSENLALVRDAARRALALDPREGSAYGALGVVELYFDWDFDRARLDVERAVALSPHELTARHAYADYLMVTGRLEESLEQVRLARDANPTSPPAQMIVLFHTAATRRADATRREARLTLERFPQMAGLAHSRLGDLLWRETKYEEALAEYRLAMGPDFEAFAAGFRRAGPRGALLAHAERLSKMAREAGRSPDWLGIAGCYAEAGRADQAFALLDEAFAARAPQLLHLVADPAFDGVRDDPRYADLLRRIGIPMAGRPAGR